MKYFLLIFVFLAATVLFNAQSSYEHYIVTADKAVIRSSPSSRSRPVRTATKGSILLVFRYTVDRKWLYVETSDFKGWVHFTAVAEYNDLPDIPDTEFRPAGLPIEWTVFTSTRNGAVTVSYRASSIERQGDRVTVWTRADDSKTNLYSLSLFRLDCRRREFATLENIAYRANGTVDRSEKIKERMTTIAPDTIASHLTEDVCAQ